MQVAVRCDRYRGVRCVAAVSDASASTCLPVGDDEPPDERLLCWWVAGEAVRLTACRRSRCGRTESGGVVQMSGRGWLVIGMVGLWSTLPASAALAGHGGSWHVVERVSVASDGSQASGRSIYPAVSGDGRIVAFESDADNLVPGDSISTGDVFVHDRATGRTELVSVARDGSQASGGSFYSAVSGDGRTVAFQDTANLWCPATATATTTCSSRSGRRHRAARSPAPQATTC